MRGAARYGTRQLWREATCLRCRMPFFGRVNPALVDEWGAVLRGERMAERTCRPCKLLEIETGDTAGLVGRGKVYVGRSMDAMCVEDDGL